MSKSNCRKSEFSRKMFLWVMTTGLLLSAGCGNKNVPQENQNTQAAESQNNQGTESQNSQETESQNTQAAESQNNQGTESQNNQETESQNNQGTESQDKQGNGNQNASLEIGEAEAKNTALQHAGLTEGDVTFLKVKLEYEDGKPEYEIEFVTSDKRYEYEIRGLDGAVLESSQEPIEQVNLSGEGIITTDQAKAALLDYAKMTPEQVTYTKIKLDKDDGVTQYEIEFYAEGREYSGEVNAVTGEVLELEME